MDRAKAQSLFAAGQYAESAAAYRSLFRAKAEPLLLYNSAHAYRLAGDVARALEAYRAYLNWFPAHAAKSDAAYHVENLEQVPAPAGC